MFVNRASCTGVCGGSVSDGFDETSTAAAGDAGAANAIVSAADALAPAPAPPAPAAPDAATATLGMAARNGFGVLLVSALRGSILLVLASPPNVPSTEGTEAGEAGL